MKSQIWFNRYFRKRNNFLVVIAIGVITGILLSQNYVQDANATLYIQQHSIPYDYDVGGAVRTSEVGGIQQAIVSANPQESVNFSIISLPHLNFSTDPLANETMLLDNSSRASLPGGAMLWINSGMFNTPLGRYFNLTVPVGPGIYLQEGIGLDFHLPASLPFNFSFGMYNETIALSPSSQAINFTTVVQNASCQGYFNFLTASLDFQQVLEAWGYSYYILGVWSDIPTAPTTIISVPPYYVSTQWTIFFIKVAAIASVNIDNLQDVIQKGSIIANLFYSYASTTLKFYFSDLYQYSDFSTQIRQIEQNNLLETFSFVIISGLFFYWFFKSALKNRYAVMLKDNSFGEPQRRILLSFVTVDLLLAITGSFFADIFGAFSGFIIFSVQSSGAPFFFSLPNGFKYLINAILFNCIFVFLFSILNAIRVLKRLNKFTASHYIELDSREFHVSGRQVLWGCIISIYILLSLIPAGWYNYQNPIFWFSAINTVLNEIISPSMPFLLALLGIWVLLVIFSKIRKIFEKRARGINTKIKQHLRRGIAPSQKAFVFLLLIGIACATLVSYFARLQTRQEKYHEDALGWVGGNFRVSTNEFGPGTEGQLVGTNFPLDQFQEITNDILNLAFATGFQGSYDLVYSTKVNLNVTRGDWDLRFIDLNYFANLSQLTNNFFYDPSSKDMILHDLQENCVVLPYSFHSNFNLNLGDALSAQIIPLSPYNGSGIQVELRITGFYYAFPGLRTIGPTDPLVCSSLSLKNFQPGSFSTDILFSSNQDTSQTTAALNSTYGSQGIFLGTYQNALAQEYFNDFLGFTAAQDFSALFAILLYSEFSIAFATILIENKQMIFIQRLRGETYKEYGKLFLWSYGVLLAIGLITSLLLGILGSVLAINSQNNFFFQTGNIYNSFALPFPLTIPWISIGVIFLLFLLNWSVILAWFIVRTRNLDLNVASRQASK